MEYAPKDVLGIYERYRNVAFMGDLIKSIPSFEEEMKFWYEFDYMGPTTGIMTIALTLTLGYKNIYVAGIDFYQYKDNYAFSVNKENMKKVLPTITNDEIMYFHSRDLDVHFLKLCIEYAKEKGANIYSVCKNSPISEYISLASLIRAEETKVIRKKPGYIDDILEYKMQAKTKEETKEEKENKIQVIGKAEESMERMYRLLYINDLKSICSISKRVFFGYCKNGMKAVFKTCKYFVRLVSNISRHKGHNA